jgi:hypothetical protein
MRANTCIHYNGTHHNEKCDAGVKYREVTPDPDNINGAAFRIPCIVWDMELVHIENGVRKKSVKRELEGVQLENYRRRGNCPKFTLPTDEELTIHEAEMEAHLKEVLESIGRGVVPPGVMVCGPGTIGKCKCLCPNGPCDHEWDGEVIEDEENGISTKTCSRCGKWAMHHDMMIEEE